MDHLKRLAAHLAWADQLAGSALGRAQRAESDLYDLLDHLLGAEHVWLARLGGRQPEVAVWPHLEAGARADLARRNATDLVAIVGRITAEAAARPVTYTNSAGFTFTNTVEDILLHLCLHGSYHRGQIARELRRAGDIPEATDYIAFIRDAPAAKRA
jgi:uncharacterized damage-inducible protein DinB